MPWPAKKAAAAARRRRRWGLLVSEDFAVGQPTVSVDGGVDVGVADRVFFLDWTAGRQRRPCTRQPPPVGIRPSFLMSTCTSSPGRWRACAGSGPG